MKACLLATTAALLWGCVALGADPNTAVAQPPSRARTSPTASASSAPTQPALETRAFQVMNVDPNRAAEAVELFLWGLPEAARDKYALSAAVDKGSATVTVTGTHEGVELIRKLFGDALQVERVRDLRIIRLARADAAAVAKALQSTLQQRAEPGRTPAVVADERTNILIVSAGPADIQFIVSYAAAFDRAASQRPAGTTAPASGPVTKPASHPATRPAASGAAAPATRPEQPDGS